MLVEFRVQNFRSLRDEQILSFVSSKDKSLEDTNTIPSGIKAVPLLLGSSVIYGANASGKSNLIKALQYMRGVIVESANKPPDQAYNVQPFRLDSESSKLPTTFEATFTIDSIRYQYGFEMTSQRITNEFLLVYKSFKPQKWFERTFDSKTGRYNYNYSPSLKGQKSVWEKATRPNALFLSMAVQLNSESLQPVFDWFANKLVVFNEINPLSQNHSVNMLRQSEGNSVICKFLQSADISISDIEVVTKKVEGPSFSFDLSTGQSKVSQEEHEINELKFVHETNDSKAVFGLGDESLGTQRLLFLTGPILNILKFGLVLVIDELDSSLHPALVRRLVSLFHSENTNPNGAQLLFSTHDTSLLDTEFFRRDQIWFTEKMQDNTTSLYPLTEFSPRKHENLERGYLMGRYGSLPFFRD